MERAAINTYLSREPFRPFVVLTSGGQTYEVRNPDMAWLLRTRLCVALPAETGDVPDRFVDLSLLHITGIEEMQAA